MADEEVTLPLGAQMAVLFFGVNIGVPFLLSAVLALVVLVGVRTHSFFKQAMGNTFCSKNLVQEFKEIRSTSDIVPDEKDAGVTNSIPGKKDADKARWADIRKRRPSVTNAISVSDVESRESSPHPASSTSPGVSRDITSSESSQTSRGIHGRLGRRRLLSSSSSRVSPLSSTPPSPMEPKKVPDSWAWLEGKSYNEFDKRSAEDSSTRNTFLTNRSKIKRKTSDDIASPSECYVNGLQAETEKSFPPVFKDDLTAFDIW